MGPELWVDGIQRAEANSKPVPGSGLASRPAGDV